MGYGPSRAAVMARRLFHFAAVPGPEADSALPWGGVTAGNGGERLVGGVVAERSGPAMLLHGPVVVLETEPLEVASQLVAAVLDHATATGVLTVFARPQSLDRVWVRFGFIPVPESTLPPALAGRKGAGLYAWRGGSALWTLREASRD